MPGQRIYYIPPRFVGSVRNWSGLEQEDGQSPLLGRVADMGFNAVWFSPLQATSDVRKTMHGKVFTGSTYSTRDHFNFDADVTSGNAERDKEHFLHFNKQAADSGIRVFADMVFNHVAADHPLVLEENRKIDEIRARTGGKFHVERDTENEVIGLSWPENGEKKTLHLKIRRNDDLSLLIGGPAEDLWSDVAQVNYASPEGRRFFIEGDENSPGYFKQVIDWHMDRGFTALRLDAAYLVPPDAWTELLAHARDRQPDCVMMAETLCTDAHKVNRLGEARIPGANGESRPAFDLGMLSNYWWNFVDDWLPKSENPRVQAVALYGGAGSPDNHDTPGTLAGNLRGLFNAMGARGEPLAVPADEAVAMACARNYAFSVLACNSSYMQMGYEFCNEKQNSVWRGQLSPRDWEKLESANAGTALDLRDRIRRINELKESLGVDNCIVDFKDCAAIEHGRVARIHCAYRDADTGEQKAEIVLLLNRRPELGPVALHDPRALHGTQGMQAADPGKAAAVGDVLIFHARSAEATPASARKSTITLPAVKVA